MSFLGDLSTFIGAVSSANTAYQNTNIINNILSTVNTNTLASGLNNVAPTSTQLSSTTNSSALENNTPKLIPFDVLPTTGPLAVIQQTGGLIFPYTPQISETVSIQYKGYDLTHSNESYNSYVKTDNAIISLGELTWTADTQENALYLLGVIHFFRSYSLMDFGRNKSGKPPSPMWFTAYGSSLYSKVPVLLEGYDFVLPPNVDYVPVTDAMGGVNWVPMKFTISGIKLRVQHAPNYWLGTFDLAQFKLGKISFSTPTAGATSTSGATNAIGTAAQALSGSATASPAVTPTTSTTGPSTTGPSPTLAPTGSGLNPQTGFGQAFPLVSPAPTETLPVTSGKSVSEFD